MFDDLLYVIKKRKYNLNLTFKFLYVFINYLTNLTKLVLFGHY